MSHFAIGAEIVERLKAEVPELMEVYTSAQLGDAEEGSQVTPCCHVLYGGDNILDTTAGRGTNIVKQVWVIVLAVQNSSAQLDVSMLQSEASLLITKILSVLQGWQPPSSARPLQRINAEKPQYRPTFAYYPFAFEGTLKQ